ncbi:hypothetical protein MANES_06G021950v8 [Manihot esculenta]|uniref:Uncharacterized protein n=1 Tax=Manihot esculenta TaxID=3983 RepID=A0ACB7HH45_MANES|nr:hypothetical protein MANES_06G021950v8 [Manihot esculenta]
MSPHPSLLLNPCSPSHQLADHRANPVYPAESQPTCRHPHPSLSNQCTRHQSTRLEKMIDPSLHSSPTVYPENFSPSCNTRFLWRVASTFVKDVDVFVLKKLSKLGRRYAFIGVQNRSVMLNLIKILNFL